MNKFEIPIKDSAADLRSYQYRAVAIGGTLATGPLNATGLVTTKTNSGEDGSQTVFGRELYVAGGTISAGNRLRVTSGGFMLAATSGHTSCGYAETATTSGSVGRGVFNFMGQTYHVSSNGA